MKILANRWKIKYNF